MTDLPVTVLTDQLPLTHCSGGLGFVPMGQGPCSRVPCCGASAVAAVRLGMQGEGRGFPEGVPGWCLCSRVFQQGFSAGLGARLRCPTSYMVPLGKFT